MTREEVIRFATGLLTDFKCKSDTMVDFCDTIIKALEQEPCEDCISRQEAIRIAEQGQIQGYEWQFKQLCNLPSVSPQQKMGRWIDIDEGFSPYKCSECEMIEFKKKANIVLIVEQRWR